MSEDDVVRQIVSDVTVGVDGTTFRSGVIGEVGCSWPLMPNERKALRASARAQLITGAPILIHPGRDETAPLEIIEVLREAGADLERTIIGHLGPHSFSSRYAAADWGERLLPGMGSVRFGAVILWREFRD